MKRTKYQAHCEQWRECTLCPLAKTRYKTVLGRGRIPAEVLFVGEAPGRSEDISGSPFVGPAGKLLDNIIREAFGALQGEEDYIGPSYYLDNLIACIPLDENNEKTATPPVESIKTCSARLISVSKICKPKAIVFVGGLAKKWLAEKTRLSKQVAPEAYRVHIRHPSSILDAPYEKRSLYVQECIVTLANLAVRLERERE